MNTVTALNATCERDTIVRLFSKFANKYGTLWTGRLGANPDWDMCIDDWHQDLRKYDYKTIVLAAKSSLGSFTDFPPTFGQFEDLCKKFSGFLQINDAIRMMIDRDFSHPIVKMRYDKIGSWALKNGKETDIQAKAKEAYKEAESEFCLYPEKSWAMLEEYNARPKELPAPSKIPTAGESKAFRECMNKCQEILKSKKIAGGGKTYKEFDANKIKRGHKEFDQKVFDEYREYLMAIPETETMILPPVYLMERNKFLNMRDQAEYLRKAGYVPPNARPHDESPKSSNRNSGPTKVYKNWAHD